MPSSTTSGIPCVALVAAKEQPFSSDRKSHHLRNRLRRVNIISRDNSTLASAMPIRRA